MLKSKNPTAIQSQKWFAKALLQLMGDIPYSDISVTQLCRLADLDRRTFYRNFDSKEDLLQYCISSLTDKYIEHRNTLEIKDLFHIIKASLEFWASHADFILLLHKNELSGTMFTSFESFLADNHIVFDEYSEFNLEYTLAYITGGYWNVLIKWILSGTPVPAEEAAKFITEIIPRKINN